MTVGNFYLVTLSFCLGILLSTWWVFTLPLITWLFFIGVICVALWGRSCLTSENKNNLVVGLFLISLAVGALRVDFANLSFGRSDLEQQVGKSIEVVGLVVTAPDVREKSTNLEIKTDEDKILVSVDRYAEVNYGDEVLIKGKLSKPESFETDLGRIFNYPGYLKAKGMEYKISFAQVEVVSENNGNFILANLLKFKLRFMNRIEAVITEPAAGLGEGLLLGVKQALGEELETAFRKTGIIHIVVLSGYNIMLVVIFVMYLLSFFLSKGPRAVVGIVAIVAFALLVGLSATVVRASIMAALLLLVQLTGRRYLVLRGLMLAGLMMLIINPYLLAYDVGFQLSFMATLGLILVSPHFEKLVTKVPNWFEARSFLVATTSTQIAVLPILLYQIGEFSVVSILVNILVLPMVPVAMLLTFLTGMVSFVSPFIASILSYPTYLSLSYISSIALWFSKLSFASFVVPTFSFIFVPFLYALLGFLLWRLHKNDTQYGYGDLGEKFLNKNYQTNEIESELAGWEIIEEGVLDGKELKKEADQRPASSSKTELPIFFR